MVAGYYSTSSSTTILAMIYTPSTGKVSCIPIISTPAVSDAIAEAACIAALSTDGNTTYTENSSLEILSVLSDLTD